MKYKFTIFTPTYNRADKLTRLYKSIQKQTFKDFEWLIVDDGSNDNTKEIINSFIKENLFTIKYFYQENQHKKVAFNKGLKEAEGEFFLPIDSDDELLSNSLEILYFNWNNIREEKENFSGVCGLCIDDNGKIIGDKFQQIFFDSNGLDLFYKYKIKGEKFGFIRTNILKEYPFPENIPNHVPEGIVWNKISRKYKTRFINEIIRIYHYEENSIMNKPNIKKNAMGHLLWYQNILNEEIDYFYYYPSWFFKVAINYNRFLFYVEKETKKTFKIKNKFSRFLIYFFYPFGFIFHLKDIFRGH